ncbi:hypothetical protein GTH32_01510 [Alteromonas sp. 345S023]|uniref:Uncharacterized protein n=1 Tax=Alteromonas profundi TaxID=2696062 RepID=A0A7X5LIA2_9ALTE|nr:hypothetical protein [Alteromonas profundi]NDV89872.1 hypothetical protein [Alteromonas profundi]
MKLQTSNRHEQDIPSVSNEHSLVVYRAKIERVMHKIGDANNSTREALEQHLNARQIQWVLGARAIRRLEKRFVLRSDLAVKEEPLMGNLAADQSITVGTFLLDALNREYTKNRDLNSLNTAVRLTDYLLSFPIEHITNITPLKTVLGDLLNILEALSNE